MQEALEAVRGDTAACERHFEVGGYMAKFEKWNQTLASLTPRTPAQTALISSIAASSASFQQTRLLMSAGEPDFLAAHRHRRVVGDAPVLWLWGRFGPQSDEPGRACFWLLCGGERDLLDLELNQPFSGLFRLPSASIEQTIAALNASPN